MKLFLIFAAVLLSTVTAKVMPTSVDPMNKVSADQKEPGVVDVAPVKQHVHEDRMDKVTKMPAVDAVVPMLTSVVGVINKDVVNNKKSVVVPPLGPVVVAPIVAPVVPPISEDVMRMAKGVKPAVVAVVDMSTPVKMALAKDPVIIRTMREVVMVQKTSKTVTEMPAVPHVLGLLQVPEMPKVPVAEVHKVPAMHKVPEVSQISPMPVVAPSKLPVVMKELIAMPQVNRRRRAIEMMPVVVPVPGLTQLEMDPKNCDIQCTKLELNPVCATNGECLHEFPNQCVMDTFNCLHPEMGFKAAKDNRCEMHWLKRCTEKEMMG